MISLFPGRLIACETGAPKVFIVRILLAGRPLHMKCFFFFVESFHGDNFCLLVGPLHVELVF